MSFSLRKSGDNLDLSFWDLPDIIVKKYEEIGIKRMFEWQAECLMSGSALNGANLIYSAPTSAGKTLVAELLMLKRVLETHKKAIMILPYVSVAREKMKHLQSFASGLNLRVDGFIGNNNPSGGFNSVDIAICTIEKANSLLNRLIEENKVLELGVLVVDELHMVGDSNRGYLLELLLTKIQYLATRNSSKGYTIQIIGMSATLPNLEILAKWLNASLYQTTFRPVPLFESIKYGNNIFDNSLNLVREIELFKDIDSDNDLLLHLIYDTIKSRLGVLVFCPTKSRCETIAEIIAKMVYKLDKMKIDCNLLANKEKLVEVIEQLRRTPAGLDSQLGKCISFGVAFHHAGLTIEERDIIENSFKKNIILVIVATSTLSSGVNLPARRVIIRTPLFNGHLLDTMTYRQMIGRAGRKGIDTQGESILMCNNPQEKRLGEELIKSNLPPIKSCLIPNKSEISLTASMKRAILEIIASGIAPESDDLIRYLSCTLLNVEYDSIIVSTTNTENLPKNYKSLIEQSILWLVKSDFITKVKLPQDDKKEILKATPLGNAVLASSMSPDEGLVVFKELQKAMQCFVLENELQIVYEITPINICDYWLSNSSSPASTTTTTSLSCKLIDWNHYLSIIENFSNDKKRVANLVGVRESFIMKMIRGKSIGNETDKSLLKIHLRFYTSLILNDLVNEKPFSRLIDEYKCQKGFLQQLQQSAATYSGMITIFCNRLGWFNLEILITQFQSRLAFGIQRELIDLIRISLLNSYRARLLYNNGFTNVKLLAMTEAYQIEKIFRSTVLLDTIGSSVRTENDSETIFERKTPWNNGNFYTNWEAAVEIINEAKTILYKDIEILGLKISDISKSEKTTQIEKTCQEESVINESKINKTNVSIQESEINCVKEESIKILEQSVIDDKPKPEKSIHNLSTSLYNLSLNESDWDAAAIEMAHQLTAKQIEVSTTPVISKTTPLIPQTQSSYSSSYFDNQEMILLAQEYDSIKTTISTPKTQAQIKNTKFIKTPISSLKTSAQIENDKIINTTIISDDILEMCEIYENNANKRTSIFKTPLTPQMTQSPRMKMIDKHLETPASAKNETILVKNKLIEEDIKNFMNLLPKALQSTVCIDKIKAEVEYEELIKLLKNLKTFLSISVAFETELKAKSTFLTSKSNKSENNRQQVNGIQFTNFEKNLTTKLKSLFLSFNNSNVTKIYIIDLDRFENEAEKDKCLSMLKNLFEKVLPPIQKICVQAKEKLKMFVRGIKVELKSNYFDPYLAYWLLENQNCSLNDLKQKYCSNNLSFLNENIYRKRKQSSITYSLENEIQAQEAFIENLICLNCMDKLKLKLQLDSLWSYFVKIESEVMIVAAYMELNGIGFDSKECLKQTNVIKIKQAELEKKIYSYVSPAKIKKGFSLNSPEDVANLLFVDLKLTPPILENKQNAKRMTSARIKHHSTAKSILEKLSNQHELPKMILEWRQIENSLTKTVYPVEMSKCFNEYLNMFRIHSTNDMSTVTGRLVLNDPCLQIIPKDFDIFFDYITENPVDNQSDELNLEDDDYQFMKSKLYSLENDKNDEDDDNEEITNKKFSVSLRNAFIPYNNGILLSADYCQLELRIIANLCKDKLLQKIINNNDIDVFISLTSEWLNIPTDRVNEIQRQQTKQIVYGIIYGVSGKTLSKLLSIDENEASMFIEKFKSKFPGLKNFISEQLELCRKNSYIETIKKRKRYFSNINSTNLNIRARAERQAINTIIQGSASDLVKTAMIKIDKQLQKKFPKIKDHTLQNISDGVSNIIPRGAYLVLQMHDELIYELNELDLDEVYEIVKTNMENAIKFDIKMKVKIKVGTSWGSLKTFRC